MFKVCPICLTNPKDMAFGCGHTVSAAMKVNFCLLNEWYQQELSKLLLTFYFGPVYTL